MSLIKLSIIVCGLPQMLYAYSDKPDTTVFQISALLQDNMVVQQNKQFTFWGKAPQGDSMQKPASL